MFPLGLEAGLPRPKSRQDHTPGHNPNQLSGSTAYSRTNACRPAAVPPSSARPSTAPTPRVCSSRTRTCAPEQARMPARMDGSSAWSARNSRFPAKPALQYVGNCTPRSARSTPQPATAHDDHMPPRPSTSQGFSTPRKPNIGFAHHLCNLSYIQYQHRVSSSTAKTVAKDHAPLIATPKLWKSMPTRVRPAQHLIAEEAKKLNCNTTRALVSLLVGRPAAAAFGVCSVANSEVKGAQEVSNGFPNCDSSCAVPYPEGKFDVKAWGRPVVGAGENITQACADRVLCAVALLHPPAPSKSSAAVPTRCANVVDTTVGYMGLSEHTEVGGNALEAVDLSSVGLKGLPGCLNFFDAVQFLDASSNLQLEFVTELSARHFPKWQPEGLPMYSKLRALDLSGCPALQNLQPVGCLPLIEAVDLSRCTGISSVLEMLCKVPNISDAIQSVLPGGKLQTRAKFEECALENASCPCTKSLKWISLAGCVRLQIGVVELSRCQQLESIDLFECRAIEPLACLAAWRSGSVKTLVWPEASTVSAAVIANQLQPAEHATLLKAATASAARKLQDASCRRRAASYKIPGGWQVRGGTAADLELASARRAAVEFGVTHDPPVESVLQSSTGGMKHESGKFSRRLSPAGFVKAMRIAKFAPAGTELSDLFRVLDRDGDGFVTYDDFLWLLSGPPIGNVADSAVALLIDRPGGLWEAAAADLAGSRASVDLRRLARCLTSVGVTSKDAVRVAASIAHCASSVLAVDVAGNAEAALNHAMSVFTVVRRVSTLSSFSKMFEKAHPKGLTRKAISKLFPLVKARGLPPSADTENLHKFVNEVLQVRGTLARIMVDVVMGFLCPGFQCNGHRPSFELSQFVALISIAREDMSAMLARLAQLGRHFAAYHHSQPKFLHGPGKDIDWITFDVGWRELCAGAGPIAKLAATIPAVPAFVFLDIWDQGRLDLTTTLSILTDGLQRRAEAAALGDLEVFLIKYGKGSMEGAFHKVLSASMAAAPECPLLTGGHAAKDIPKKARVKKTVE